MKLDFAADARPSSGLVAESTHQILGPSTSLADYRTRLEQSGLAIVAALAAANGTQLLLQVHGMPRWIARSQRWLIAATHDNAYGTHVASGLNAAIAAQALQQLDTQLVTDLDQIRDVALAPHAVTFLEVERDAALRGCTGASTVGAARLRLTKLRAPEGDDELALAGADATATTPPTDPLANGPRVLLTDADGVVLADLAAPSAPRGGRTAPARRGPVAMRSSRAASATCACGRRSRPARYA